MAHADYGEDRAEDFVLRNGGVRSNVIKNCRWHEIAVIVHSAAEALTTEQESALFLADFDVMQIGFQLRFVDGRAHIDYGFEAVARAKLGSTLDEKLHEFVGNGFFNDNAAGSGAALARGGKGTEHSGLHGKRQIGVCENDQRIFAAHFALALLHAARALRI